MSLHPFYHFLKGRKFNKLPGRDAQFKMSPEPLDPEFILPSEKSDTAHSSSVLVPLYPDEQQKLHVILTLRADTIPHAGQISFPGGRCDAGETFRETAIRETEEEIGIHHSQIQLACSITPLYLYRSDNQITPFVGFLKERPELKPNPDEVEEIFSVSLDELLSNEKLKKEKWELTRATFNVPFWDVHTVPLWGATAMMMNELLELYREFWDGMEE